MTCYAQYYQPKKVTTNCCKAEIADLVIDIREVTATVIRGKVTCADGSAITNMKPLIVVTNTTSNEVFYAIAAADGTYEVLVKPGTYEVAAFPACDWYTDKAKSCTACGGCPAQAIE